MKDSLNIHFLKGRKNSTKCLVHNAVLFFLIKRHIHFLDVKRAEAEIAE